MVERLSNFASEQAYLRAGKASSGAPWAGHALRRATVLLAALLAPGAALAAPLLQPALGKDETYTESFVTIALLDDGSYLKVQLGISNAGAGDGKGACRIFLSEPRGAALASEKIVDRGEWRWTESPHPTLSIGTDCRASAQPERFEIHAAIEGTTIDLSLLGSAKDWRRSVNEVKSAGGFYELEVLLPFAKAEGRIERAGAKPRAVTGYGYADHSRANAIPKKTADRWVRFRALNAVDAQVILIRFPPGGGEPEGWRWAQPNRAPTPTGRVQLTGSARDPAGFRLMLEGEGGPFRIRSGPLVQRDAPLEGRGALGGMLGAVIGNPVNYTYRAAIESKQKPGLIQGILEVGFSDE